MPGGDRTGPWGLGSRTGRTAGYCAGYLTPGYANPGYGRVFGRGWGRGFGRGFWGRGRGFWWRRGYPYPTPYYPDTYPEPSRDEEKAYLEDMVKGLEEEMKMIRERLQELSKEKKESSQ
jgi:hypothetical protein